MAAGESVNGFFSVSVGPLDHMDGVRDPLPEAHFLFVIRCPIALDPGHRLRVCALPVLFNQNLGGLVYVGFRDHKIFKALSLPMN